MIENVKSYLIDRLRHPAEEANMKMTLQCAFCAFLCLITGKAFSQDDHYEDFYGRTHFDPLNYYEKQRLIEINKQVRLTRKQYEKRLKDLGDNALNYLPQSVKTFGTVAYGLSKGAETSMKKPFKYICGETCGEYGRYVKFGVEDTLSSKREVYLRVKFSF